MEAIKYVKQHHKPYIGLINKKITDKYNHNYYYYDFLYTKFNNIISQDKKLSINICNYKEFINENNVKVLPIPYLENINKLIISNFNYDEFIKYKNLKDIQFHIRYSKNIAKRKIFQLQKNKSIMKSFRINENLIVETGDNELYTNSSIQELITKYLTLRLNITLPNLKTLKCLNSPVYINSIQPIETLIISSLSKYLLTNMNELLFKLPNLKTLGIHKLNFFVLYDIFNDKSINFNCMKINNIYKRININKCINDIKDIHKLIIGNDKIKKLNLFINTNSTEIKNLDKLKLNFYDTSFNCYQINKIQIKLTNIQKITLNTYYNVNIKNINKIKINQSTIQFKISIKDKSLTKIVNFNTLLLNCFNYNYNKIEYKKNYYEVIFNIIKNLLKKQQYKLIPLARQCLSMCNFSISSFLNYLNYYGPNIKQKFILKLTKKICNKYIDTTYKQLKILIKSFDIYEDEKYFIFKRKKNI